MFQSAPPAEPVADDDFSDVSGVVLAHLVGGQLSDLGAIPDSIAGDAQLTDLALGLARLEDWCVAQRARVLGVARERVVDEQRRVGAAAHRDGRGTAAGRSHAFDDERFADRIVGTDLSLALGVSTWHADRDLHLAAGLTEFPALGRALSGGRLDRRRAELLLDEIGPLADPAHRQTVMADVVGYGRHGDEAAPKDRLIRELRLPGRTLRGLTVPQLRRAIRRECDALEPQAIASRAACARAHRDVVHRDQLDAMGEVVVSGPRPATTAAFANVDLAARALRGQGDSRTIDQLRADVALGWLTEGAFGTLVTRPPSAPPGQLPAQRTGAGETERPDAHVALPRPQAALIVIAMDAPTALGRDQSPATLYGPGGASCIPADLAREIAFQPGLTTWRRLLYDDATGIATDVSRSYAAPPRMATFVQLRDGLRTRLPTSEAWRVELDHVTPFDVTESATGGPTTAANLASAGRRDHHLKTDGALRVTGDANGQLEITTRSGHTYQSWPEQWGDPSPPF